MNQAPNFLYNARDFWGPGDDYGKTTVSTTTVVPPQGALVPVASTAAFEPQQHNSVLVLSAGGAVLLIGRITKQVVGASLFVLPYFDPGLQSPEGITVPSGSTIAWCDIFPLELPIDLSQASAQPYKYLILTQASVWNSVAACNPELSIFTNARPGMPYFAGLGPGAGTDRRGLGVHASGASLPEMHAFFSAHSLTINGGDTRSVYLSTRFPVNGPQVVGSFLIAEHARMAAFRVDECSTFVEIGDGKFNLNIVDNPGTAFVFVVPTAGTYTVIVSGMLGSDAFGSFATLELMQNSTLIFTASQDSNAGERFSVSFMARLTVAAGDVFRLNLRLTGGGAPHFDSGYMCAFTDPPYIEVGSQIIDTTSINATTTDFGQTVARSFAAAVPTTGRYFETISVIQSVGIANSFAIRPRFGGDGAATVGAGAYASNYRARGAVEQRRTGATVNAFFHRTVRGAGQSTNYVDAARLGASTAACSIKVYWLWFKLKDTVPRLDQASVYSARFESALYLKAWLPAGPADVFQHAVDGRVSRVMWAALSLTKVTGTPTYGQYSYDETTATVKVCLAAGKSPADKAEVVLVCIWFHAATLPVSLIEKDGSSQPYQDRLMGPPRMTQSFDFQPGTGSASASLGDVEVASADGVFDQQIRSRRFDGMVFEVRAGALADPAMTNHVQLMRGLIGGVKMDRQKLRFGLYSALISLRAPVTEVKLSVFQGTNPQDILAPRCFGPLPRVPFYRTTNLHTGPTDNNSYRCSDYPISSIGNLYVDGAINTTIAGGNIVSKTIATATVVVKNAAFVADTTNPPDVIYGDIYGHGLTPATAISATNRVALYPGEMARALLTMAKLSPDQIDEQSFFDLDLYGRRRYSIAAPNQPVPPLIGLYFDQSISVVDALNQLMAMVGTVRLETLGGRLAVSVPDFRYRQAATNSSFEADGTSAWPWVPYNGATLTIAHVPSYGDGANSCEVGNGSNAQAVMTQTVVARRPGRPIALTPVVAARSGETNFVRVGVVRPSDGINFTVSDPISVTSTAWKRLAAYLRLDEDEVGTMVVALFPALGSATSTAVVVDDLDAWPLALVSRERVTDVMAELDETMFYAARVQILTNLQAGNSPAVILTDGDLKGIGASLAKYALPGSGQADPGPANLGDGPSATGVAAALLDYFGKPRHSIQITEELPPGSIPPGLCDVILDDSDHRRADGPDSLPIYVVRNISFTEGNAVQITAEAQTPLVSDPVQIAPGDVPLGMIVFLTSGATCPPDFDAYDPPNFASWFFTGLAPAMNPTDTVGAWTHVHAALHKHTLAAHAHTVNSITLGASDSDGTSAPAALPRINVSRGPGAGDHTHPALTGGPWATGNSAAVLSSDPNSSVDLPPGGNIPAAVFDVKLCKRVRATAGGVPTLIGFLYEQATAPGGYARASVFDGYWLRWASNLGAASTTVAVSAVTPVAGVAMTLNVAAGTSLTTLNRILTVTSGANHFVAAITAIPSVGATSFTIVPLGLVGDTLGVSYPVGSTVTAITTFNGAGTTWAQHQHGGALASHAHNTTHSHPKGPPAGSIDSASGTVFAYDQDATAFGQQMLADELHTHNVYAGIPVPLTAASSNATGTVDAASTPNAPTAEFVMVQALAGTTQLAASLIGMSDASGCPAGWTEVASMAGRLLKVAAAGLGMGYPPEGHSHPLTFAAHTLSHNHGGSTLAASSTGIVEGAQSGLRQPLGQGSITDEASFGGFKSKSGGHLHSATLAGITTVVGSLAAVTGGTSSSASGAAAMPPAMGFRFCKRN